MKVKSFRPIFVKKIPDKLDDGILYVCFDCDITIHNCACGCGEEVALPLASDQWRLIYDGRVTLYPSIGNWSYPCKSHYFIKNNNVVWAGKKFEVPNTITQKIPQKRKSLFDKFI